MAGSAFGTPTVVHFCAVLLLAAFVCAPWHSVGPLIVLLGLMGVIGLSYSALIMRRFRRQTAYSPEFEDWLFHILLPYVAYAILTVSAISLRRHPYESMFGVAGAALLLLFIGIHNAWDVVTYHVFVQRRKQREEQ